LSGRAASQPVDALFADPPLLHVWDGESRGGGLSAEIGAAIAASLAAERSSSRALAETGAGLSTLLFLTLGASSVISIDPDEALRARVYEEAARREIDSGPLSFSASGRRLSCRGLPKKVDNCERRS